MSTTDREETAGKGAENDARNPNHDFAADYESDYTLPALTRQNQNIESGLMSPHDIPESMPVLRAFHEFLDQERRRNQRRMLVLSCVCVGLVAIVIVCGILLIANYGTNARYQYKLMERDLADVMEDAAKAKTVAESSVSKYADKTDKLKDMIVSSQQQLVTIQTRTAVTAEQQQRDIESLRRQIESLQASRSAAAPGTAEGDANRKRQDELIRELEKTRAELLLAKAAAERPAPAVQERPPALSRAEPVPPPPPLLPPVPISRPPAVPAVPPQVSVTSTTGSATVQMSLVPQGSDRPVSLRMPVPPR